LAGSRTKRFEFFATIRELDSPPSYVARRTHLDHRINHFGFTMRRIPLGMKTGNFGLTNFEASVKSLFSHALRPA
jgi:hypothetical protein